LRRAGLGSAIEYIHPDFKIQINSYDTDEEYSELYLPDSNETESNTTSNTQTANPVIVAVIDTGVDISHPVIAPYLWGILFTAPVTH